MSARVVRFGFFSCRVFFLLAGSSGQISVSLFGPLHLYVESLLFYEDGDYSVDSPSSALSSRALHVESTSDLFFYFSLSVAGRSLWVSLCVSRA